MSTVLAALPLWQQKMAYKTLLFKLMGAIDALVLIEKSQGGAYMGILRDVDFSMNCSMSHYLSLSLSDYVLLDFSNIDSLQNFYQKRRAIQQPTDEDVTLVVKGRFIRSVFMIPTVPCVP